MATGINLGSGSLGRRAAEGGRRWARGLAAALAVFLAVAAGAPDLALAGPGQGQGPGTAGPRFQPPLPEGRPRPAPGQVATAKGDAPARASVSVMVVHANRSGRVDPQLVELRRQLEMQGFTGATVLSTHDAQLGVGQDTSVSIAGGRKLQVTLIERTAAQARIRIVILREGAKTVDTTVTLPIGKAFPIAGPEYQDGKLLFPVLVR